MTTEPQKVTPISILNSALVIGASVELHLIASGVVVQITKTIKKDIGMAKLNRFAFNALVFMIIASIESIAVFVFLLINWMFNVGRWLGKKKPHPVLRNAVLKCSLLFKAVSKHAGRFR